MKNLARRTIPLFFAGLFIATLWLWYSHSGRLSLTDGAGALKALGRLSGLIAAQLILVQILLIGRVRWIEASFGLDRLSRLHHKIGISLTLALIIHPFFLTLGYAQSAETGVWQQLMLFLNGWEDVWRAGIAFIIFAVIVAFSVPPLVTRLKYETWYYLHLGVYVAGLLAFGHQLAVGGDLQNPTAVIYWYSLYAFALGNFFLFRWILPLYRFSRHRFRVEKVVVETEDVYSVYITGRDLERFRFQPGQFAIFRFLDRKLGWQAHPFSFSAAPNGKWLRISVKKSGDFTSQLNQIAAGTPVIIDGPLGVFTAAASASPKRLFIAGGIGITPIRAQLEGLGPQSDSVLFYATRLASSVALNEEIDRLMGGRQILVTSHDPDWTGERGHIDAEKIKRLVPDFLERDAFLCGPPPMMTTVRQSLISLGLPKQRIHFEQFSL
ncbi:MAG: ferredoxin reductase family protein [Alphaproteobacteria bacterium]|nr:ferredoxin reductase family protein [Alphaproteobacteria bacterium]